MYADEAGAAVTEELLEQNKRRFPESSNGAQAGRRLKGVIVAVCVPLALVSTILLLMPRISDPGTHHHIEENQADRRDLAQRRKYAVIFDAGSSGSRVHVYAFNEDLELVKVGSGKLEIFVQKKPGLSSYALNPKKGAESLQSLLDVALESVPEGQHSTTPVLLGATAGLRLLPGDQATNLLKEVTELFHRSAFKFKPEWVSIIDGTHEGSYQWVTVNYLLSRIGEPFNDTVGIVDLGGGSVQMAYAISDEESSEAPDAPDGQQAYVRKLSLMGASYNLYVHSYLNYGLLAARAEVLKRVDPSETCPCLGKGFEGTYTYGGKIYNASASEDGGDYAKCNDLVVVALNENAACPSMQCTFDGVWSGGGGDGLKSLFVASFFFDRALDSGIVKDADTAEAEVKPSDFEAAAKKVCNLSLAQLADEYPDVQEDTRKFLCMDLTYQYTLLATAFQVDRNSKVTLVKKVKYSGAYVETAWPLGSAIELVSLNKE